MTAINSFRVYVGNGGSLVCNYQCKRVPLSMQGHIFYVDLYVLPIKGPDIVLGVQWLQELGTVAQNFASPSMEFVWKNTKVLLQGDNGVSPCKITFLQLQALLSTDNVHGLFELVSCASDAPTSEMDNSSSNMVQFPKELPMEILDVLHRYIDLFKPPIGLPPIRAFQHKIHLLPNTKPVNVQPYRYPHFQKVEMEKLVNEMLQQGIIQPSQSPFSSPVLLVKKKDGTFRFYVDYRALNAVTIKDKFPIPTIDELFDELGGAIIFSKLDLRAGYHQIRMHDADVYKMAFRTHVGHYKFLVMLFGLSNAPSIFQAAMNYIFAPFLLKFVVIFFDDILLYSASLSDHVLHMHQIFQCLAEHQFYLKLSKCSFDRDKIDYLGHLVDAYGIHVDPSKIEVMVNWSVPKTLKQLRAFLGFTRYYRRFIKGYATLAAPLTDLLQKDNFTWSTETTMAFNRLKEVLLQAPILRLPDFSLPFVVETDAS